MYLKKHIKSDIIIPQHISLIGVFTAHMFLPTAVLAYQHKTYLTTAMLLGLYTSSILHWRKNKSKGLIRTIDMIIAFSTITRVTLVDISLFGAKRWAWIFSVAAGSITYIANKTLFYNQALQHSDEVIQYPQNTNHWFFSMCYTNPNTEERENAYYRTVLIHCFFQHIVPNIAAMYALLY
jgi:hypothetical protein